LSLPGSYIYSYNGEKKKNADHLFQFLSLLVHFTRIFLSFVPHMSPEKVCHNTEGRMEKKSTSTFMPIAACIVCDTLGYKCVMSTQDDKATETVLLHM
jgi:hypothetical protein